MDEFRLGYLCACAATVVEADIELKKAAGGLVQTARIVFSTAGWSGGGATTCYEKNSLKFTQPSVRSPALFVV